MLLQLRRTLPTALLALLLLTSCASTPPAPVADTSAQQLRETPLDQAQTLESQGDYGGASQLYERTAQMLPFPRSEVWRAKSAEMAWKAGQLDRAESLIDNIDGNSLNRTDRAHVGILGARIARQKNDHTKVIQLLAFPRESLPRPMQSQILALLYQAYGGIGDTRGMVQVLVERLNNARSLNDSEQLWQLLRNFTNAELMSWKTEPITPTLRGWIDLAHLAKTSGGSSQLENALIRWEQTYRNHPAAPERVAAIRAEQSAPQTAISTGRIAVLLPMSGALADVSRAILDGIMAAQIGSSGGIQVYDSGNSTAEIWEKYQLAVSEGADLVIGPLDKDGVDMLADQSLSVPVISLNYGKNLSAYNPNLFQFALLPEDEAAQAAERISLDGHQQAVIFVPKNEWGNRIAEAFQDRFRSLGGNVLAIGGFDPNKSDASPVIRRTLNISNGAHRSDVDAIFMATTPIEGRLMKPLFRFHHAGNLPVYATSHIFSGKRDSISDGDLNGVYFNDMPWLLGETRSTKAPSPNDLDGPARQIPRLFAFGFDSISLAPKVRQLAASPLMRHEGLSGEIYSDETNRLHRITRWAQFSGGWPKLIGHTPEN